MKRPKYSPNKGFILLPFLFLTLLTLVVLAALVLLSNKSQINPIVSTSLKQDQTTDKPLEIADTFVVSLNPHLPLNFNRAWSVSVVQWTDDHSLFRILDGNTPIEIEYFSKKADNLKRLSINPLITSGLRDTKTINGNRVSIFAGNEHFGSSQRKWTLAVLPLPYGELNVSVMGNEEAAVNEKLSDIVKGLTNNQKISTGIIKEAKAQETKDPKSLSQIPFKEIKVMEDMITEQITSADTPYKTGFAKGYKFFAFKSQRLTANAFEIDSNGSFVESQLFDENGKEISAVMGTRIEFNAPYSGEYYFVVNSFSKKEGTVRISVDDRAQTDVSIYVKYPDGHEVFKDPNAGDSIWLGKSEIGIIFEIPNPITVTSPNSMEYMSLQPFGYPRQTPHLVNSQVDYAYIYDGPYKVKEGQYHLAEDSIEGRDGLKLTQIGTNRVLITLQNGLFPADRQISFAESSEGIIRFMTYAKEEDQIKASR